MGEEFLEGLVKRSLVSVSKRKSNHRMKKVGIHDLVWDFCTRQAQLDHFFLHVTKFLVAAEAKATLPLQRRVSACFYNILPNVSGSTIRTITCLEYKRKGIRRWLKYFRLLRIMDLSEGYYLLLKWNELPNQVFEYFHLRYLALAVDRQFSGTIPKAILNLQNLQSLIIRPREYHQVHLKLPVEIWSMLQLRHVVVLSCVLLAPAREKGEARFALENLQTLNEAEDFICSREILKMIPNLKKLCIFCKGSGDNYELYNLIHFQKLEILKIKMNWPHLERQRIVLLDFPPTLRKLSLRGVGVPWEDMKIVGSLPNLQELQLRDHACVGGKWETNEGGFSKLNSLLIHNSDLEHWITVATHFPRLKCLVLRHCRCLREIPNNIREIPTLEYVELPMVAVKELRMRYVFVHSYVLPNQEEEEAVNLICSRENLKRIPNLRKLRVLYTNWRGMEDEYELHNLIHLEKLEILELHESFSEGRSVNYLQKLKFPHTIKELSLTMSNGFDWEDMLQNIGSLPLLLKLKLANGSFRRGKWEIAQGQFPCLKLN